MFFVWRLTGEHPRICYFASNVLRAQNFVQQLVQSHISRSDHDHHGRRVRWEKNDPDQHEFNDECGITHTSDGCAFGYDRVVPDAWVVILDSRAEAEQE